MDLSTVKSNLQSGIYEYIEECLDDIQLIWDNCKLYNCETAKIYKIVLKLEHLQNKLVNDIFPRVRDFGKNNESYDTLQRLISMNAERLNPELEEYCWLSLFN